MSPFSLALKLQAPFHWGAEEAGLWHRARQAGGGGEEDWRFPFLLSCPSSPGPAPQNLFVYSFWFPKASCPQGLLLQVNQCKFDNYSGNSRELPIKGESPGLPAGGAALKDKPSRRAASMAEPRPGGHLGGHSPASGLAVAASPETYL